jgi:hypothetical protein
MRLSFGGHVFYSYLCALNREDGLRLSKNNFFCIRFAPSLHTQKKNI